MKAYSKEVYLLKRLEESLAIESVRILAIEELVIRYTILIYNRKILTSVND